MNATISEGGQQVYTCQTRENPEDPIVFYEFLPVFVGDLTDENTSVKYSGRCFEDIKLSYEKLSDEQYEITLNLRKPKSWSCSESFMFGNTEIIHLDAYFTRGTHKVQFDF